MVCWTLVLVVVIVVMVVGTNGVWCFLMRSNLLIISLILLPNVFGIERDWCDLSFGILVLVCLGFPLAPDIPANNCKQVDNGKFTTTFFEVL